MKFSLISYEHQTEQIVVHIATTILANPSAFLTMDCARDDNAHTYIIICQVRISRYLNSDVIHIYKFQLVKTRIICRTSQDG